MSISPCVCETPGDALQRAVDEHRPQVGEIPDALRAKLLLLLGQLHVALPSVAYGVPVSGQSLAASIHEALVEALGGDAARVSAGDSDRDLHGRGHDLPRPTATGPGRLSDRDRGGCRSARARTTSIVCRSLRSASGSSLEGHVIPVAGGISLDLNPHEPDPRRRAREPERDRARPA